ncbi:MAG: enoyl-CoA hydratase-related protein, partial [Pseudomonadota bacterium]|nr:enoyl-CoA hydratase-related protein [Pseudomonadota bacterium]
MTLVLTEKRDSVALVTMNRPDAMNALSAALRDELAATIEALEADANIRVLILTGAGTRAFTAGLDLKELGQSDGAALSASVRDPVRALANFS